MNITISHQNPMINFRKQALNHKKSQKSKVLKISPKCMKICMKHENKTKRRDRMVLSALREENLAKILEENDKKIVVNPCQVGERRKVEKLLKKMFLKQSKNCF